MNRSGMLFLQSNEERRTSIARVPGIRLPETVAPERETRWTEKGIQEIIATLKPFAKRVPAIASLIREPHYHRPYGEDSRRSPETLDRVAADPVLFPPIALLLLTIRCNNKRGR